MNKATKRGTRMLAGIAKLHGHRLGRFAHDMATVNTRVAHSRCQHEGCMAEGYVYTKVVKGKSVITGAGVGRVRKGCSQAIA